MLKHIVLQVFLLSLLNGIAKEIRYELSMPQPQNHYFHVSIFLNGFSEDELLMKLPVWTPGSYLVRDFPQNINLVKATQGSASLSVNKMDKNTWRVKGNKGGEIRIDYEVYAFELSVRTSFLDLTHGFVSGASVFMYVDQNKDLTGQVDILPHPSFSKITTALREKAEGVSSDGRKQFTYKNYDELVDCPIEIGNQDVFTFRASGVEHTVAMYGTTAYDQNQLKMDMIKIVEACTAVFGTNPNKDYTFIIHHVQNGQGGLEHSNSTVLSVNRWTYDPAKYKGFLSLVAHEYFHLWNVKRLRPVQLGPFDYDKENYTDLLWVMEGFTSYYDELLLLRAGYYTQDEFLGKLFSQINYVEGSPGSRVQPLAHASFDAWIKAYKPTSNSRNTTMTYYSRGAVMAALFDAKIISHYKGKKGLDDFLRLLYDKYYIKLDRGFSEKEFQDELSAFLNEDMSSFFQRYIYGTEIPDYRKLFEAVGLSVNYTGKVKPDSGLAISTEDGKVSIKGVRSGSSAEKAGLSVGDELVGWNGFRADEDLVNSSLEQVNVGDTLDILFARDGELFSCIMNIQGYEQIKFSYRKSTTSENEKYYNYWLRK